MPMTGNALGDAMLAAIDGQPARSNGESMTDYRRRLTRAEGGAIVAYIQANALVTVSDIRLTTWGAQVTAVCIGIVPGSVTPPLVSPTGTVG